MPHPHRWTRARGPARQLPGRLPRPIGLHRAAPRDEPTQHRVIHPGAGDKPRPNLPALRRIRPQRPRPDMGGRTLRTLPRPRPTRGGLFQPSGRCRFDAIPITHLHTTTVEVNTDNPDLSPRPPQRVLAARAPGVRAVRAELDVELVEFNGETDHVHLLVHHPAHTGDLGWCSGSRAAPPTPCAASTPDTVSAPACADTPGPRPTSPSPAEAHRCRSSRNTSTAKHGHSERRATPDDKRDGLTPGLKAEACAQEVPVNMVSVGAFMFAPAVSMYAAGKAALTSFTRSMAAEFAPSGIRVNALAPGPVDTDMMRNNPHEFITTLTEATLPRRLASADEMVGPALLLTSTAGSYLTGRFSSSTVRRYRRIRRLGARPAGQSISAPRVSRRSELVAEPFNQSDQPCMM